MIIRSRAGILLGNLCLDRGRLRRVTSAVNLSLSSSGLRIGGRTLKMTVVVGLVQRGQRVRPFWQIP